MRTKRRRVTTSTVPPPPPPPTTTIASLPDDVVADILLRLPSPTSIFRAALASKHWCRVAVSPPFVRRIRELHHFPALLGHFLSCTNTSTLPLFQPVDLHADPALAAVVRRGDFFLTRLQVHDSGQCAALEDCHDGFLLFSTSTKLTIYDPTTHHAVHLPRPPCRPAPENDYVAHTFCLLRDSGGANDQGFFRVISLQHHNRSARAEEYDSRAGEWRAHPCTALTPARSHNDNRYFPAMHAAGRIYWKYSATPLLLCLDTKTMLFSYVGLPAGVSHRSAYAVGETEDGTCCLVHLSHGSELGGCPQLQVWRRGDDDGEPWVLEREEPLLLSSSAAHGRVRQVRAVVAGLVLVCFYGSSAHLPHVAFRLKDLKVEAEFTCRGPARPYLFQ